ncbi:MULTISPECIES: heavy metal translocating P-type ATPase [unclassified Haloferax]|jgi:heavy metal translocating P-type ATPase|uniref:heavy metal translocating P-type ATPase n=1 Tax=unclassified Haloferax TaxID=2625095 RepID=UPI0028754151|nr:MULTISPECIES: heavy metal translocating P-type ATPase [unclassified Haloferax]MDS0243231.1 heavy metal translocating P-type ATPase [Haloferax sp. S2CR25]MDS0446352.1 heavy metal translocating P-type ATPase [Haloferax sp. S2CR25-2]
MAATQVQYNVGGMSCSFCAETINKALERTDGVEDATVSLAHEEILIQYEDNVISEVALRDTLRNLGYTIRDPDKEKHFEQQQAELEDGRRRLLISGIASLLSLVLMGVMVARNDWNIFAETDQQWMWYGSLALALVTMFGPGIYIKTKAYNSLRRGIFNQHVLLEAGAFAGLAGGFLGWFVFAGSGFPVVHFFVVSTFITTYHILSEYTSLIVRTRASRAVNDLMNLQPDTARRVTAEDEVEEVDVDDLEVGDKVRVKPGETLPIDGEVVEGESAVDESVATGESAPIDKQPGDEVIGGSVNETGTLLIEVTAVGDDAFLNQVARQIEEARAMKPGIVQLADRILKYFVPGVLTISVASFLFWTVVPTVLPGTVLGTGPQFETAAFAALAVLVLGYPCALGMATPLALIRGGGEAARRGILMRSGDAFQVFQDVDHIVLDKTGTITKGKPAVDTTVRIGDHAEVDVLRIAASAEAFSEHPLADAILDSAADHDLNFSDPESFDSVTGKGVRATIDGDDVLVGKPGWLEAEGVDLTVAQQETERLQSRGLTTVGVVSNGILVGLVGIGDELKPDAKETVDRMTERGITPVMITGDNERTAHAVAEAVGIERVMAEVLPDAKREEITKLQDEGHRVAMVGDGINDAPALTQADIGIAIGAGTDIAIESADIVLMGDRLGGVMDAYEIGETSYRKTKQNLIAAFSFNGIGVTAATTGLVHPVFAMIAMIASVSAVLANSFAGQLLSGEGIKTDFSVKTVDSESTEEHDGTDLVAESNEDEMTNEQPARESVLFDVDLHCGACEERVRETLRELDGVRSIKPDATHQRVEIEFNPHVTSAEQLREVIVDLGYRVSDSISAISE